MLWHEATRPQFASCLLSWVQYWLLGLCFLLMPDGTGLSPAAPCLVLQTPENWGLDLFMPVSLWLAETDSCPWSLAHSLGYLLTGGQIMA